LKNRPQNWNINSSWRQFFYPDIFITRQQISNHVDPFNVYCLRAHTQRSTSHEHTVA